MNTSRARRLTACGPGADGSTEEGPEQIGALGSESDGAKTELASPAQTLKPQKLKQHVD
jgi:hypothetical protein